MSDGGLTGRGGRDRSPSDQAARQRRVPTGRGAHRGGGSASRRILGEQEEQRAAHEEAEVAWRGCGVTDNGTYIG